ncbi:hypothetical protein [Pseudomonas maumuensis]|uniref:Uncharacterized protein n=1 Tax=Pseudomonas maumuensis TaxID=2842354 RepID=A0ABX8NGD2_9PSED|nr:hypothetical protein [Pseudomonas maumuensis]QXH55341.1 hypothetical protein KSS90_18655 [Pseudomonas maumuensis]
MTFEIPAPLLSWMKDESSENNRRLYGWDMIIGLPLELLNAALQHDDLQRLATAQGVEGLGGPVAINDSTQQYELEGYRLSNLALQVAATNYGTPRVKVSAVLEGGTQIRTQGLDAILTLNEHPPFAGIDAGLELPISYSAGTLATSLRDGLEHELAVSKGEVGQENAAKLFSQMLGDLEAPRAKLQMAQVQVNEDNPLRKVKEMQLRTQVDGNTHVAAGQTPPSCVLLFINFEHGGPVDYPRVGDTFPYLLGSDGESGQGCTALLSRHLLHRVAFAQSIMASLQGGRYDYGNSSAQPLPRIDADEGVMSVPKGLHHSSRLEFVYDEFVLDAASGTPLHVTFEPDRAIQTWQPRCSLAFQYRIAGSEQWTAHSVQVQPQLNYSLQLIEADATGDLLQGRWLAAATEPALIEGLPAQLSATLQDEMASALEQIVRAGYLNAVNARPLVRVTEQLLPFLRLFETRDLRWQVGATPNNLVVTGAFEKVESRFRIEQQELQLVAGQKFTFTVQPPRQGLKWRAEALPGGPVDVGLMNANTGAYQAPTVTGGNLRIKVVAEDPVTGMSSSVLVSVNTVGLMMAPLFKYLIRGHSGGDEVRFVGVSMAQDDVRYTWQVEGEAGVKGTFEPEADTSAALYKAGPRQAGRTYVVDRISMTSDATQAVRGGVVLSEHGAPELSIVPAAKVTEQGLKLEAYYGENEDPLEDIVWEVVGPGKVMDEYYVPDPTATDAFVVIIATLEYEGHLYQGHLVRPLPLDLFPRLAAAQAARKRRKQNPQLPRLSMHQEGVPSFDLLPKGPLAVGPGSKVQFVYPLIGNDQVKWKVEREEGDSSMAGSIDAEGLYTAGNTDTGWDRVSAEVWLLGSLVATGTTTIKNISDMPVWDALKTFDLTMPAGGVQLYGNGHMQIEVGLRMEVTGVPIQLGEAGSVRLFSKATSLKLPEITGVLPKNSQVLWAFSRNRNSYDLAGSTNSVDVKETSGILESEKYYILSREEPQKSIDCYAGLQDRHGAWHYSTGGDSEGTPTITVTVKKHEVNRSEYSFERDRVRPPRRGNEDDDFDLELNSADYWRLVSSTGRKFLKVKVLSGSVDAGERSAMAVWEDDHDQVDLISYTGWAFWSTKSDATKPTDMRFDIKGLTKLTGNLNAETHLKESINPDHFTSRGLLLGNFRADNVYFKGADKESVGKYKNSLLYKLQDSQGNTTDLWVSYDAENPTRYRDYLIVKNAEAGVEPDDWDEEEEGGS